MAGMEERTSAKLSGLNDGHMALAASVSEIAETVTQTRIAVARIEGEREAERREAARLALDPEAKTARHWTAVAAVIAALVAIPAAIVAGWEVAQGVATMVMHALGAHR